MSYFSNKNTYILLSHFLPPTKKKYSVLKSGFPDMVPEKNRVFFYNRPFKAGPMVQCPCLNVWMLLGVWEQSTNKLTGKVVRKLKSDYVQGVFECSLALIDVFGGF